MFKVVAYIDDALVATGTGETVARAEELCKADLLAGDMPQYSFDQLERVTFECEEVRS